MTNVHRTVLLLITLLSYGADARAQSLTGGAQHTVALADGVPWTWGTNTNGQLADGTNLAKRAPAALANLPPLVEVAAGGYHTVLLTDGGQVYTAGYPSYGQLGLGPAPSPPPTNVPRAVTGLTSVVHVAAGIYHTLALTADGTVVGVGLQRRGPARGRDAH